MPRCSLNAQLDVKEPQRTSSMKSLYSLNARIMDLAPNMLNGSLPKHLLLAACIVATACFSVIGEREAARGSEPSLGSPAPEGSSALSIAHKGGELCSRFVVANGVEYNFDVECGKNTVLYIQTLDPKFSTPEGLAVGMKVEDALRAGGKLTSADGCGVRLPSDWIARPPLEIGTFGKMRVPCDALVDEPIQYFDMTNQENHNTR